MISEKKGIRNVQNTNSNKLTLILVFMFFIASNIILFITPPIEKYEVSIYTALPVYYWIAIVTSILLCIILIIKSYNEIYFRLAIVGILFNYTVLIFLSFIRGYFLPVDGAWDVYYHIAQANYIESEGLIHGNRYPMLHIILMLIRAIGITNESMAVSSLLAVFHILFMIVSIYAITVIFNDQKTVKW